MRQYASPFLGMGNNPVIGVDPTGGKVYDYWIHSDGSIEYKFTGNTDNYYYVNEAGTEHYLGTFTQNSSGLIQLPSNWGLSTEDFTFGFSVKAGNESRSFIRPDAFASLMGALIETNTADLTIVGFSKQNGSSPWPSSSHVDGKNGDLRYLRTDKTGGPILVNQVRFDQVRNARLTSALNKYGWKSMLSERTSVNHFTPSYLLPYTTHFTGYFSKKTGQWINSRHNDHLYLQGYQPKISIK
jgi:hypothetical protein